MKKIILFLFLIIVLGWCVNKFSDEGKYDSSRSKSTYAPAAPATPAGSSPYEGPKTQSGWSISEECLAAIDEEKFSELTKICNRYDQDALTAMLLNGYAKVLNTGDKIEMVDYGFAKCKIKLENGQTYYVACEFVTK